MNGPSIVALLVGVLLGSLMTFVVTEGLLAPEAAAPAAVRDAGSAVAAARHDAASAQYVDWYTRPSTGAAKWAAATEQYTAVWYARAANLAGSTTATEQYESWYLRDD